MRDPFVCQAEMVCSSLVVVTSVLGSRVCWPQLLKIAPVGNADIYASSSSN
jgi:hypothetical protein